MKILVLCPLDEKMVYAATGIWKNLDAKVRDKTFVMPMFMEYLRTVKVVDNWVIALYDAIVSARNLYDAAARTNDDLIIIGNAPSNLKFDAIFNFQDIEASLPYEDLFLQKVKEMVSEDDRLFSIVDNLYKGEASTFTLQNCQATGEFLSAFLDTDPHIAEIEQKYAAKINVSEVKSHDNQA